MKLMILFLTTILWFQIIAITHATGQGTIGIHAINDRYVLVTDSNVLSVVVVDILLGGIAGIMTFPTSMYNKDTKKNADIHFISVTSCDACLYIHLDKMHWNFPHSTEDHILEIGPLERPLLEMAKDSNFTAFNTLSFERDAKPVWPFPKKYLDEKNANDMRMLRSRPSGGVGFLARRKFGILRYQLDSHGKMIPDKGDVFFQSSGKISGINFSSTYKRLVAAGKTTAYVFDITEDFARISPSLDDTNLNVEKISLSDTCINGKYRNSVLWDDDPTSQVMIVDGHDGTAMGGGTGIVLQKLTKGKDSTWDCDVVAGKPNDKVGWRDGCGSTVRFTRPHDMTILPGSARLIITDIDNRAIRLMDSSPLSNDTICISTVSYDEGLYTKIFPDSQEGDADDRGSEEEGNHNEDDDDNSDNNKKGIRNSIKEVVASKEEAHKHRKPYILEAPIAQVGNMSFHTAQAHCQSSSERKNSDICSLEEIRTLLRYDDEGSDTSRINMLSNPFWTKESCKGCWKHRKGVCRHKDPSWDSDYHMVAAGLNLDSQSKNERGLRTECLQNDETITPSFQYMRLVCCGSEEHSKNTFRIFSHLETVMEAIKENPILPIFSGGMCILFFLGMRLLTKRSVKEDVKYDEFVVSSDYHIIGSQSF